MVERCAREKRERVVHHDRRAIEEPGRHRGEGHRRQRDLGGRDEPERAERHEETGRRERERHAPRDEDASRHVVHRHSDSDRDGDECVIERRVVRRGDLLAAAHRLAPEVIERHRIAHRREMPSRELDDVGDVARFVEGTKHRNAEDVHEPEGDEEDDHGRHRAVRKIDAAGRLRILFLARRNERGASGGGGFEQAREPYCRGRPLRKNTRYCSEVSIRMARHPNQKTTRMPRHPNQETTRMPRHPNQKTTRMARHPNQKTTRMARHPNQKTTRMARHLN